MVQSPSQPITLESFLTSAAMGDRAELVNGQVIPKMSPKRFHAKTQKALLKLLDDWAESRGHFYPEWSVVLTRQEQHWVPIPDLMFVSYERLSADWDEDAPSPVPPDLAIEIISPDQTFGEMVAKATDYLAAGVIRVWIVDPKAESITVFYPAAPPTTFMSDQVLTDDHLAGLRLAVAEVF
ncbi:MAG: Uma2 family endonuclease [Cyanobacteria bacterium P01_H01_bin.152]